MSRKVTKHKKLKFSEKLIASVITFALFYFAAGVVYAFLNHSDSFWSYTSPTVGLLVTAAIGTFEVKEYKQNKIKITANPMYDLQREIYTDEELKEIFKEDNLDLRG